MDFPDVSADFAALPRRKVVNGATGAVSYRDGGQGRVIVFLHGLLGSADSWVEQFTKFAGPYRVVAWDASGYGQSSVAEPDLDVFVDALAGLLEHLNARDVTLVGHSMGGVLAVAVAAQAHAGIKRLVLSCTHAGYAKPKDTPPTDKLLGRIKDLKEMGAEAYGRVRAEAMVGPNPAATVLAKAAYVAAQTRPHGLFSATRMLQFADVRPLYNRIAVPTTVITGGADPVVTPDMAEGLKRLTPFADHITIDGAGHAPYLEKPQAYNEILARVLAS